MAKLKDKFFNRVIEGKLSDLTVEEIKEAGLALASETATRYVVEDSIDELPSDFVASLHQGDVVVTGESTYIVTYLLAGGSITFTEIGIDYINNVSYGYEDGEYVYYGIDYYEINNYPRLWKLSDFFDEDISDLDVTGMKSGDIIIDDYTMLGIVIYVTTDRDGHITNLRGVGIDDDGESCFYNYNTEDYWNIKFIETGTKLYQHRIATDVCTLSTITNGKYNINTLSELNSALNNFNAFNVVKQGSKMGYLFHTFISGPDILTIYLIDTNGTVSSVTVGSITTDTVSIL